MSLEFVSELPGSHREKEKGDTVTLYILTFKTEEVIDKFIMRNEEVVSCYFSPGTLQWQPPGKGEMAQPPGNELQAGL